MGRTQIVVHGLPSTAPVCTITPDELNALVKQKIEQWLPRIFTLASLYAYRCNDALYDFDEITTRLKIETWLAVTSFDPEQRASIDSWIFHRLRQACSLMIEERYVKNRDVTMTSTDGSIEIDPEDVPIEGITLEDLHAKRTVEEIAEHEQVTMLSESIKSVMITSFEREVFDLILSYDPDLSDQTIADNYDVDFAKVAEVRLKAKVALAILVGIKFETFTLAKNAEAVARRVATALHFSLKDWRDKVEPLLLSN